MLRFRKKSIGEKSIGEKGPFDDIGASMVWCNEKGRRLFYAIYDLRKDRYLSEPVARILEHGEILRLKETIKELSPRRYEIRFVSRGYIPRRRKIRERETFWAVPDYASMKRYGLEQFLNEN